jgi:ABC-type transporter Mla subunit MlaD
MVVTTVAIALAAIAGCGASRRVLNIEIAARGVVKPGEPVRVLGQRYGTVDAVIPVGLPSGQPGTVARVTLDEQVGPVPVDSVVRVRRDDIDLVLGNSTRIVPDGGFLPVSNTGVRLGA